MFLRAAGVAHPVEPGGRVHVMQSRNGHDQVERRGLERVGEELTKEVLDVTRRVLTLGTIDAGRVTVDRRHVPDDPPQLSGQDPSPQPTSRACSHPAGTAWWITEW